MEKIRKFFQDKLHLLSSTDEDDSSKEPVLKEATLDGIVEYIKENNITKIITMAGAGISTCE